MLFAALLLVTGAASTPFYTGRVHLPFDLSVGSQQILKKDTYQIVIQPEPDGYSLNFSYQGQPTARVKAQSSIDRDAQLPTMPATGTLFLRSSALPVLTDEERHYSRTGKPQYAEADRDWEATLRVYQYLDRANPEVHFIFQQRDERRNWGEVRFILKRAGGNGASSNPLE